MPLNILRGSILALVLGLSGVQAAEQGVSTQSSYESPQASLQAQAVANVKQDKVRLTLTATVSADSQREVSQQLNPKINRAMDTAKANDAGVKVYTGNYRVWPTNKDGKIVEWRGQAAVVLESEDFEAASQLAADMGEDLVISDISFFVSDAQREKYDEQLIEEAVAAFHHRAATLTKALGFGDYRVRQIDLDGSGHQPMPMPRMAAMVASDSSEALTLESGSESIQVTVRGSIYLENE